MDIGFRTTKLRDEFNVQKTLKRNRGKRQADLIMRRMIQLANSDTLKALRNQPGRCHALTGDKAGWLTLDLDGNYRLVFEPNHEPIPKTDDGGLDWGKVTAVTILGVLDTHEQKNKKPV